jgi:hypothetical protein
MHPARSAVANQTHTAHQQETTIRTRSNSTFWVLKPQPSLNLLQIIYRASSYLVSDRILEDNSTFSAVAKFLRHLIPLLV